MDYFAIAANIARAHESKRQAAAPCKCAHYPFPHRRDSVCIELAEAQDESDERTLAEINDEMRYLHDRDEASAINAGRSS